MCGCLYVYVCGMCNCGYRMVLPICSKHSCENTPESLEHSCFSRDSGVFSHECFEQIGKTMDFAYLGSASERAKGWGAVWAKSATCSSPSLHMLIMDTTNTQCTYDYLQTCGKAELWLSPFFKVLQFDILSNFRRKSGEMPEERVKQNRKPTNSHHSAVPQYNTL